MLQPTWKFLVLVINVYISNTLGEQRSPDTSLVKLNQGLLSGIEQESLNGRKFSSFLGIPFAKPPIGDLRFEDPEDADAWDGIYDGSQMPNFCKQYSMMPPLEGAIGHPFIGEEDCLYLNIHVPKLETKCLFPVMVFIHGGGFASGGSQEYSAKTLMDEDIILVQIQYRLGIFGFFSTEDDIAPGNYGLKDQTHALKWIQNNIVNFGGDRERVTLFGQSAGAASVHYQLLSPWAKGLFQRAILQSGSALAPWAYSTTHREYVKSVGEAFSCSLEEGNSDTFKSCMKRVDADLLVRKISDDWLIAMVPNHMAPRVDRDFLPDDPAVLIRENKYHKMVIMSGINRDEGASIAYFLHEGTQISSNLSTILFLDDEPNSEEIIENLFRHYFAKGKIDVENVVELIKILGDRYNNYAYGVTSNFLAQDPDITSYLYELHFSPKTHTLDMLNEIPRQYIGHSTDLEFLFSGGGLFDPPFSDPDSIEMQNIIVKLWTNFARSGNPTPDDSLGFQWTSTKQEIQHLQLQLHPEMKPNNLPEKITFWKSLPLLQNKLLFAVNDDFNKSE